MADAVVLPRRRLEFDRRLIYFLPLATIVVLGGLALVNLGRIRASQEEMVASQQLLVTLKDLITQLADAETGQRGYLLTGEASYLEPYHAARFAIGSTLKSLQDQYAVENLQPSELNRLRTLVDAKLVKLAETIRMFEANGRESTLQHLQQDHGKELMDEIRVAVDGLENQRVHDLKIDQQRARDSHLTAIGTAVVALLLTLAAITWALLRVDRELSRRTAAELATGHRLRQLRVLTDIVSRISAARDINSLFGIALHEYRQLIGVREAIAQLGSGATVHYESSLMSSFEPRRGDEFHQAAFRIASLAAGAQSAYFRTRGQLESNPAVVNSPEWKKYQSQIDGLLSVPMVASSRSRSGRLLLIGKFDSEFDDGDLSVSLQLAHAVAIAVENTRLAEATELAAHRKDEFLAMLGHELRNPLAGILTGSETLCHAELSPQAQIEMRDLICRQAYVMNDIVNDLLDVSRIARGKVSLAPTQFDLSEAIEHLVSDYRNVNQTRTFTLSVDSRRGGYPVFADRTRIGQCLTNLLHNACKFSPEQAPVRIKLGIAKQDPNLLEICVIDQGVGLNARQLDDIFELFHQVDTTIDRSAGGLGLGLTLARGLIEMHRGTIHAESDGPGHGSTFCIKLPLLLQPDAVAVDDPPASQDAIPQGPLRILTVDDRADARLPIKVLLEKDGHQVFEAESAAGGIDVALRELPDIILCDIGLPGDMNGYDVVRTLRTDPALSTRYIVALSGYSQDTDRRKAADAGFDFHVAKPIAYDTLSHLVQNRPQFARR